MKKIIALMIAIAILTGMLCATAEAGAIKKAVAAVKKVVIESRTKPVKPNAPGGVRG